MIKEHKDEIERQDDWKSSRIGNDNAEMQANIEDDTELGDDKNNEVNEESETGHNESDNNLPEYLTEILSDTVIDSLTTLHNRQSITELLANEQEKHSSS